MYLLNDKEAVFQFYCLFKEPFMCSSLLFPFFRMSNCLTLWVVIQGVPTGYISLHLCLGFPLSSLRFQSHGYSNPGSATRDSILPAGEFE